MNRVAESIVHAERQLGIDSHLCDVKATPDEMRDADVHVSHTHFTDGMRRKITKPLKLVWVAHGTPEHVFKGAVEDGAKDAHGHADGFMLCQHMMRVADARVTFWPRHQKIWQSLCDNGTKVHCLPMGVDRSFWKKTPSNGKWVGDPSIFTAENCHDIKWPLDLFIAWPWVYEKLKSEAKLHAMYVPKDMHRWWFPLVNRNGCSYSSYVQSLTFDHTALRNAFNSVDYYIGLVRYGDFNRICLEANACGTNTISYAGNPYSDFWVPEGDQRIIADELARILNGEVEPRKKEEVPDIAATAEGMKKVYESIL